MDEIGLIVRPSDKVYFYLDEILVAERHSQKESAQMMMLTSVSPTSPPWHWQRRSVYRTSMKPNQTQYCTKVWLPIDWAQTQYSTNIWLHKTYRLVLHGGWEPCSKLLLYLDWPASTVCNSPTMLTSPHLICDKCRNGRHFRHRFGSSLCYFAGRSSRGLKLKNDPHCFVLIQSEPNTLASVSSTKLAATGVPIINNASSIFGFVISGAARLPYLTNIAPATQPALSFPKYFSSWTPHNGTRLE